MVEQALREFLENRKCRKREARDLRILNANSDELNLEAQDVLGYQIEM